MITNKFTAYGLTVAVAFAAAVVLLLAAAPSGASADAGSTVDAATTIDNAAAGTAVAIKGTHVSGKEVCDEGTFGVSAPVGGTAAAAVDAPCTTITTTVTAVSTATATTLTVASTTGFPDSGSIIIDGDGNGDLSTGAATVEIIDYTGKTATSFTGLSAAKAGTTRLATAAGANVWPAVYSQLTIGPADVTSPIINVTDASGLVAGGTTGADLILDPSGSGLGQAVQVLNSKSGNTLTLSANATLAHVVGEYVAQISGVNTDTATSLFTRTASDTTEGSFKFSLTANGQTSTTGTMSLTIIVDKPVADAFEASAQVSLPTPLPVIIPLTGSDSTEDSATPSFAASKLPTKGLLGTITTAVCTDVALAAAGEVQTNCLAQVIYTPLLGATGTDTFEIKLTNGGEVSDAAIITVVLAGGSPTPTPGAGFTDALVAGVNLTTYGGGTLVQLATDAAAAGATSVSVTSSGSFLVHVVGAPDFVNAAFAANFPSDVPAGTVVLVLVSS